MLILSLIVGFKFRVYKVLHVSCTNDRCRLSVEPSTILFFYDYQVCIWFGDRLGPFLFFGLGSIQVQPTLCLVERLGSSEFSVCFQEYRYGLRMLFLTPLGGLAMGSICHCLSIDHIRFGQMTKSDSVKPPTRA